MGYYIFFGFLTAGDATRKKASDILAENRGRFDHGWQIFKFLAEDFN